MMNRALQIQQLLTNNEDINIYHDSQGGGSKSSLEPSSSSDHSYMPSPQKKSKAKRLLAAGAIGLGVGLLGAHLLSSGHASPNIGTPGDLGGTGLPKYWVRGS